MTEKEYMKILKEKLELTDLAEERIRQVYQTAERNQSGRKEGGTHARGKKRFLPVMVAAVLVILAVTVIASVSDLSEEGSAMMEQLFGNSGRESREKETDVQIQYDETGKVIKESPIVRPAREYVEVDQETARKALSDSQEFIPLQAVSGNVTLTLESFVSDGTIGIARYCLECPDGVEDKYDIVDYKGYLDSVALSPALSSLVSRIFQDDRDHSFPYQTESIGSRSDFHSSSGFGIFDRENSTDTCVYYTEIGTYWHPDREPQDTLYWSFPSYANVTVTEVPDEDLAEEGDVLEQMELPKTEAPFRISKMERKEKRNELTGELLFLYSPMSMSCVFYRILPEGTLFEKRMDREVYYLALEYENGDRYVVYARTDSDFIDNTNYILQSLGDDDEFTTYAFNRLVDWDLVTAVQVNDIRIGMR